MKTNILFLFKICFGDGVSPNKAQFLRVFTMMSGVYISAQFNMRHRVDDAYSRQFGILAQYGDLKSEHKKTANRTTMANFTTGSRSS